MNPAPIDPRPDVVAPPAEAAIPADRLAICVFQEREALARLVRWLQGEGIDSSTFPARQGESVAWLPLPIDAEMPVERSDWTDFLQLLSRRTSRAIAVRLAGELAAGRSLLVILFADVAQESRILPAALAAGALSVQVHDLST